MISFESDYNNGAHPLILEAFLRTNNEQTSSYGADRFSESARARIREACKAPDAQIYFLAGGTQTNATVLSTILAPYEGVVAVDTAHIAVHEAGAVEYTGHKVLTIPNHQGRMAAAELEDCLCRIEADPSREHIVNAGAVYLTYPTELGTIYSKSELEELCSIAHNHGLKVYLDGARMGYGVMAEGSDVDIPTIASLVDCFYIGGTKVGALCGEAVVFPNGNAPKAFFTQVKQHGALLAKSRVVGVQFDTLFTGGLYLEISRHAIEMAKQVREIFVSNGFEPCPCSPTNQQFFIMEDTVAAVLRSKGILFEEWEPKENGKHVYRFVTSWATKQSDIAALRSAVEAL